MAKTSPVDLPRVTLIQRDGKLYVRHKRTAMEIEVSQRALDSWCINKLRESLALPHGDLALEKVQR